MVVGRGRHQISNSLDFLKFLPCCHALYILSRDIDKITIYGVTTSQTQQLEGHSFH